MKRNCALALVAVLAMFAAACGAGPAPKDTSSTGYEIFVRSYYDTDGNGIGDFNGITKKLDYINDGKADTATDLGVDTIYLMPINPTDSYHGYDVTDYYDVNPEYGTKSDFKKMVKEAHRRGVRVVIDLVMNHTSRKHQWFIDSTDPKSSMHDWYVWKDEKPEGWITFGSKDGPWYPRAGKFYYALFWEGMPDLNYKNPEVREEMKKVANYWMNSMGVDGFRLDASRYIVEQTKGWDGGQADSVETLKWWKEFQDNLKESKEGAFTIGEVWAPIKTVSQYYIGGAGFTRCFDFDFSNAMVNSINQGKRKYMTLYLKEKRTAPWSYYAPFWFNHDQQRSFDSIGRDYGKAKAGFSILLTMPGMPFIYYGEEIGMVDGPPWERAMTDKDPQKRSPMQWAAGETGGFTTGKPWKGLADASDPKNVAAQDKDAASLLNHVRTFTNLRAKYAALRADETDVVVPSDSAILAYLRKTKTDGVLVVTNLSGKDMAGELNFFGTAVPTDAKLTGILAGSETLTVTPDTYKNTKIALKPYETKMFHCAAILDASKIDTKVSEDSFRTVTIVADNTANKKEQIFLFGTFSSPDGGAYKENIYGDVVEQGYPMYDDGTHGDAKAGDNKWTFTIKLMKDFEDPYTVKFGFSNVSTGDFLGSFPILMDDKTPKTFSYKIYPRTLKQRVTLYFSVDLSRCEGATEPGIRGTMAFPKWNNHVKLYDDGKTDGDKKADDKIFTGKVEYPTGSLSYIEYKYNKNNEAGWEKRPNRNFIVDSTKSVNYIGPDEWDK